MKLLRIILNALWICLLFFGLSVAQDDSKKKEKSKDAPIERSVEVEANVKVLDAAGNYFNDLKLENLKVFEDGVEQKITYLARKEPALNLGLVIDNTGSMRPQLDRLVGLGVWFADTLNPRDEAFAVRFINSKKIELLQEWTSEKFRLKNGLENMFIEGGQSAVIDALYLSAGKMLDREKTDKSRRYAMLLISDAEDRESHYKTEELLSLLKNTDIQIFVIAITNELPKNRNQSSQARHPKAAAENLAQRLSLETGGSTYVLGAKYSNEDLTNIARLIADELRYQYVIGYTSTNKARDGSARKLRVEIADGDKGEKRQGFIRESFVVPKEESK